MAETNSRNAREPKLTETLIKDVRHSDFRRTLRRDYNELKEFYLDKERKARLKNMGRLKRGFWMGWWLLKSLFFKLTPVRRILLVISCWLMIQSGTCSYYGKNFRFENDTSKIGFVVLLFVLMLELKDKLTAQSELEAGRSVQRALMPERNPKVPGWELWLMTRPANEVGGDFVDFLEIDKNCFGVALGDVAGKGLKAALLMVKLQATLRALAADFTSLAELGTKLNAILRRDGLSDSFASMVYLELQSDSGMIRLLNAGHMPPLVLRDGTIQETSHGAVAIGMMSEARFTEQQIELRPGDTLLIYSDGLTDAVDDAGNFWGEQRLLTFLPSVAGLSARQLGERLVATVDQFVGEARAHDDLSLIVLKRMG
ncbi:MAG: serine/threonine-protein phosphatase [candidate division KSB1 bacterium]|nr:serine/threonine-protein phosphatase [candidate division KSB1 bacterium]MDZ7304327.1 serine/threonine-protein phosphatase [candidate division KSB1 bacterium]MDZ7313603.1 serine/threonine-protein phosphatase [candidate division KSB1 bacterium]